VVLMIAGGLYRPLAKRLPESRLLAAGVALMIVGLGGLGLVAAAVHRQAVAGRVPTVWENLFFAVSAIAVVGFAFVNPSVSSLLSRRAGPDEQGEVLGVNQSFASLGRILGPFLGSLLFSLHDSRTLPFVAAVAVLFVVVALLPRATAITAAPTHTVPTGGEGARG
jgi:MFS transporter, DHA1 family, tetracycline resistance protein